MRKMLILITLLLGSVAFSQDVLFPRGSQWAFLDDGAPWEAGWTGAGFDDSSWKSGRAKLGYGDSDVVTRVSYGPSSGNKFPSVCFRARFQLDNPAGYPYYIVRIQRDDGAVLHINGSEVLRSNMPEGEIGHRTFAASTVSGSAEDRFFDYVLPADRFTTGANIIAVSVHQRKSSSSDLAFDLEIEGTREVTFHPDGPYVFHRDGLVVTKAITRSGPVTESFPDKPSARLMCRVQAVQDSFAVTLMDEIPVYPDDCAPPEKILAVSDIEGNFTGFRMILQGAGVMDSLYHWTFGPGHLVILGDLFDRGENVTECLWLVYHLESQAVQAGGRVHYILGNHDIMNLIGDTRYVHPRYFENASMLDEAYSDLYSPLTELGRWLRTKHVIERIGNNLFVHGGVSPAVAHLGLSLHGMNSRVTTWIDAPASDDTTDLLTRSDGLFWYRGLVRNGVTEDQVDEILAAMNASRIIVGHSIVDEITGFYGDKVIAIDLDHEENTQAGWMNALFIDHGKFHIIDHQGETVLFLAEDLSSLTRPVSPPEGYELLPASPNPFNPATRIGYRLPRRSQVVIDIFNIRGRRIRSLARQIQNAGSHHVMWDGTDDRGSAVGSGVYLIRLCAGAFTDSGRLILIK